MPPTSETWFDAIAKVASTIEGIRAVFAGGRTDLSELEEVGTAVQPMIDEELMEAPAAVLSFGGGPVVLSGQWLDQKWALDLGIWIDREPIGTSYALAVSFIDKVLAAFPPHAKAFELDPRLQHVIPMSIDDIRPRTWPEGSARQFIVLPVTLEARVAHGANVQPS